MNNVDDDRVVTEIARIAIEACVSHGAITIEPGREGFIGQDTDISVPWLGSQKLFTVRLVNAEHPSGHRATAGRIRAVVDMKDSSPMTVAHVDVGEIEDLCDAFIDFMVSYDGERFGISAKPVFYVGNSVAQHFATVGAFSGKAVGLLRLDEDVLPWEVF